MFKVCVGIRQLAIHRRALGTVLTDSARPHSSGTRQNDRIPLTKQPNMNIKDQQRLLVIQRELSTALQLEPSHKRPCARCSALSKALAEVTALHADILDGVLRSEIRRGFARRLASLIMDVVKVYTKA